MTEQKNEFQEQLTTIDEALAKIEAEVREMEKEPETKKEKLKSFISRLTPLNKKVETNMQIQFLELSYSILVVQKQFLQFVSAVQNKQLADKNNEYKDNGVGMYE